MMKSKLRQILLCGKKLYDEPLNIETVLPLYDKLLEAFVLEGIRLLPPELIVYSSYNKEVVTKYLSKESDDTSASYLLFDTHLLDILGEFTESFLATRYAESQSRKLMYRLLAENMYVSGKFHQALYFAYQYRAAKNMVVFSKERNRVMARHLLIQEAFVLCHELSHWCLFRSDVAERNRQLEYKRSLWNKYLDDLIKNRTHKGDVKGAALLAEMSQYIQTDDGIVEEVACDTFAAIYLAEYMSGVNGFSKIDIAVSSFLCIQNLQLLSFLEQDLGTAGKKVPTTEWLTFNMTLRMIIYKHHLCVYFDNYAKEIVPEFNEKITKTKETYDERVFSPFINVMNQAQSEIVRLGLLPRVTFLDDNYDMMNQLVRDLLEPVD